MVNPDQEIKINFIEEARQLLDSTEQYFLDLENQRDNPEVIANIFRLAHNLKGTARAVGYQDVAHFTHILESLLTKIKEGAFKIDDETISLLLECNDHLKTTFNKLSADLDAPIESGALTQKLLSKIIDKMNL